MLSKASADVLPGWSYLPFQVYANSIFPNTVGQAYAGKGTLSAGLSAWQQQSASLRVAAGLQRHEQVAPPRRRRDRWPADAAPGRPRHALEGNSPAMQFAIGDTDFLLDGSAVPDPVRRAALLPGAPGAVGRPHPQGPAAWG